MFQIKQFSEKIILDEELLGSLRQNIDLGSTNGSSAMAFAEKLDAYLSDHLRGIEYPVKKQIKIHLYENHFKPGIFIPITYYHVAHLLIELQLPSKQFISNFQNWILMSTEFTVDLDDIITIYKDLREDSNPLQDPEAVESYFQFENEPSSAEFLPVNADLNETTIRGNLGEINLDSGFETDVSLDPEIQALTAEEGQNLSEEEVQDFSEEVIQTFSNDEEAIAQNAFASTGSSSKSYRIKHKTVLLYVVAIGLFLTGLSYVYDQTIGTTKVSFRDACILINKANERPIALTQAVSFVYEDSKPGFPRSLGFMSVNKDRLRGYLKRSNSLLADEPYFSKIMEACAKNDVHPALLFAIAGQEQGFVKRGSENAALIVNNPFNVYHSWSEYNTNIEDSATIASITVRNILTDRPQGENAFKWLNKTYAEDPNWWTGTETIFFTIEAYIGH